MSNPRLCVARTDRSRAVGGARRLAKPTLPLAAVLLAAVPAGGPAVAGPDPLLQLVQNNNRIVWVSRSNGEITIPSVAGGRDSNGQTLFVCVASHNGGRHPGKVNATLRGCRFGYGGRELTASTYLVLGGAMEFSWTPSSGGHVPRDAIRAGAENNGRPLFVCRAEYGNSRQLGKVGANLRGCNIGYGGREYTIANYEVLTQ